MFKNIREELKLAEKRQRFSREAKGGREREEGTGGFLILRSQLHQQLYQSEDKMEFYRINRHTEVSGEFMRRTVKEKEKKNRYALNPFDQATISCTSASLNTLERDILEPSPAKNSHATATTSTRRVLALARPPITRSMSFSLSGDADSTYQKKLKSYLDFLFKINYSNNLYVELSLSKPDDTLPKYKVFIGRGNNSLLVKSILKRRFWWEVTYNVN
jgi:hypothetical protein